ncbi:MAG: hypothetical protein JW908_04330 [Anaerolineales bacterium]|nr:hypothetical protein [Anaerolineales bacterium]
MATLSILANGSGYIVGAATTYSVARSTSSYFYAYVNYLTVGQWLEELTEYPYRVGRAVFRFDTSPLEGKIITSAYISMAAHADYSDINFSIQIVEADWSAQYPISASTREAAYDKVLAGTSKNWRNTLGMSLDTVYNSSLLRTAYINKSGFTYYGLRSHRDKNNVAPTTTEFVLLYSEHESVAARRPYLVVNYDEPALGAVWFV